MVDAAAVLTDQRLLVCLQPLELDIQDLWLQAVLLIELQVAEQKALPPIGVLQVDLAGAVLHGHTLLQCVQGKLLTGIDAVSRHKAQVPQNQIGASRQRRRQHRNDQSQGQQPEKLFQPPLMAFLHCLIGDSQGDGNFSGSHPLIVFQAQNFLIGRVQSGQRSFQSVLLLQLVKGIGQGGPRFLRRSLPPAVFLILVNGAPASNGGKVAF